MVDVRLVFYLDYQKELDLILEKEMCSGLYLWETLYQNSLFDY